MPESVTSNRTPRLKILSGLMIVLGMLYAMCVPLLLYLTTTPDITQDKDAQQAIHGMRIGAVECAILAAPTLLLGVKLLQRRRWAYWLVVANLGICVLGLGIGTFEDFSIEWSAFWFF